MFYTNFFRTKQIIAITSDLVVTLCHKTHCNNFLNRLLFKDIY